MNRIYKVIWSKTKHCYVVVSELAKRHAKGGSAGGCRMMTARVLSTLLLGAYLVGGYSLPSAWADGENTGGITRTESGDPTVYTTKIENQLTVTSDGKVQWGNQRDIDGAKGEGATAWGYKTYAIGAYSTAWGNSAKVEGDYSTAWGNGTSAEGVYSTAWGGYSVTNTTDTTDTPTTTYFSGGDAKSPASTAWGVNTTAGYDATDGIGATAWGHGAQARSDYATAWGNEAYADGAYSTAWGDSTTAQSDYSTAWGVNTTAGNTKTVGIGATAFGNGTKALGDYSTAFGSGSVANASNSLAALGGTTDASATNSVAIGVGAQATLPDSIALGSGAVADRAKYDGESNPYMAYLNEDENNQKEDPAWRATHNAIAVGASETDSDTGAVTATVTRQITGVAAGTYDTDAVNVAQLKAATVDLVNIQGVTRDNNKTTIEQGFTVQTNFNSGSSNGYMNVNWGQNTLANGENATAWGKSTVARSPRSTAWGNEATAKGDQATAFGSRTTAYGVNSTAWGADTVAFSHQATAFGENTTAGGQRATAWGHKTTAGGDSSTAYGKETSALMEGATAWGNNTKAGRWTYTDDNSVVHDALVIQPYTDVHNGSEMYEIVDAVTGEQIHNGENDYIDAYDWLAAKGTVNGVYSTAWGNGTQAAGDYSTAFGNYTKTAAVTSLKFNGTEAKVVSEEVVVTDASGKIVYQKHPETGELTDEPLTETKYKIANAVNSNTNLIGDNTYFDTEDAAMKYLLQNATITGGYGATAFGLYSEANGAHSTAFGVQTVAEGIGATAWGNSTTASGKGATASGYGTKAEGDYSTAFGNNTTTAAVTSLKYRDPDNNDWTEAKIITKNTDTGLKYVIVEAADPNKELYFSYFDTEDAAMNQIALDGKITGGYGATAFGLLSEAKGAHSTAFGVETVAEGTDATAWGRKAKATGDYSTAWGFNTEAINDKSTAFGDNTIAGGKIATAWGYKTAAGGRTSTAFGSETVALTEGATAWGNNTKAGKWTYAGHDVFIKKEGDGRYHIIDEYGNSGSNGLPGQTFVSYDEAYKELSTNGTVQGVYATAWGKDTKAEGDYSTAFGNYTKTAAVTSLKYNGTEAKVVSEVVKVKDANGNPVTITDPGNTESGETIYATELKYTIVKADNPKEKLSDTYFDSEDAAMKEIVDKGTIIGGYGATAFGLYSEAKGAHSTAFGVRTTAGGIGATAWGNGTQATGDYSTAFGNGSVANASNSLAALGGTTAEDAVNSLAVGLGAQTTLPDSIALGSGAVADRAKYDDTNNSANEDNSKTGSAWRATANAIAIGHIDTSDDTKSVTRQIIGVAAGTEDTDAVNVAQLKAATFDMQGITRTETGTPGEAGYVATTTIENNLSVSSDGKVKWGKGTTAEGDYSTAGGFFTKANGQYATAFGRNTQANGYNSTAFGNAAKANGQYTTAFGSSTEASGDNSTAFGSSTKATGPSSTAFGRSTEANGYNSTAFGNYTQANGQDATAFGSSSIAAGDYSTAFGSGTQAGKLTYKKEDGSETEAKIVGYTTAAGDRKYKIVSLRNENDVLSDNNGVGFYYYDVLRDSNLTKQGDYSTAFGSNTVASGDNSTAFGSSTQALGDFSTAFGSNTVASGDNSTAFGSSTKATGSSSTAFGSITEANGPSGTAFGSGTMANGQHSTAFGSSSIASGYISTAFGSNTQAGKLTYKKADGREIEAKIVEYTTAAGDRKYKIVSLRNENDVLSDNNGAGFNMYDSAFLDNNLTRQGDYSTAFGSSTIALGDYSTAWGFRAQANGGYSTAFGSGTEASGTGATAWGSGTKAGGDYSTAWGFSAQANGTYSTAFGNGSVANAYNSLAALGGTTGEKATNSVAIGTGATVGGTYDSENQQTEGANAFAFGNGAQATLSNSVALGSGAIANRAKYNASNNAYKAYLNEDDSKTNSAWRATHNAIAIGSDDSSNPVTRQIIGVAAGSADTDAVNVAQLKAATFNMGGITRTETGTPGETGYVATTTIENNLSVSSDGKVQWGDGAKANGDYSTAIGAGSEANGKNSIALGDAGAQDENDIARKSIANGANTLAVLGGKTGYDADADDPTIPLETKNAIALGGAYDGSKFVSSTANADYSLALLGGVTGDLENDPTAATNSLAVGLGSVTKGANSVAVLGGVTTEDAENSLAVGAGATTNETHTIALGYGRFDDNSLIAGTGPNATGEGSIAIGAGSEANGKNSIALGDAGAQDENDIARKSIANGANTLAVLGGKTGYDADADDPTIPLETKNAIALGGAYDGSKFVSSTANADYSLALLGGVTGDLENDPTAATNSLAVGLGSVTKGANSVAVLGGVTTEDAENSLAVGEGAQATLSDSIALGSGAVADRAKYDTNSSTNEDDSKTGSAWRATANAIAIGHIDTTDDTKSVTRQIIGVAAGTEDTDAVNVAQLKAATCDMQGITRTETGTPGETGYVATTTIENNLSVSSDGKVKWGNNTKVGSLYYVDTNTETNTTTKIEAKVVEYKDSDNNTKYKIVRASDLTDLGNNNDGDGYDSYAAAYDNLTKEGTGATAWGNGSAAIGDYSTAWGNNAQAIGAYSTAIGNGSVANATNSLAVLGGTTAENATGSAAIGAGAQTTLADSIALGSGAVANRAKYGDRNYSAAFIDKVNDEDKEKSAWKSTANAIAVGSDDTSNPVTRQIIGVAAGSEDTDAVNVAQLRAATVDLVNIQGIARSDHGVNGYDTTIEGSFSVWDDGRFGTRNFAVGADGTFSAFGGKFTVDSNGINVGNMKITGLADGSADTDAVNVAQLKAATFNMQGIKRTETGTPGETGYVATTTIEDKLSVSSNGAFSISGDKFTVDSDGAISAANGKFSVNSSGVLTVGSATQNTSVSDTGLTIKDGPSVTKSGIDAGDKKISGVATAVLGTDAVNYQQLIDFVSSMQATGGSFAAGEGLTTETVSGSGGSFTVLKVDKSALTGTIDAGDEGEGFVTGKSVYAVTSPLQEKTQNITFTAPDPENATDSGTTTVSGNLVVGDDTDFVTMTGGAITTTGTVTAGTGANQVVIGNDGVNVGGSTYISSSGLNANSNKISNVADGVDAKDAVNVGQLSTAISGVTYTAGNGILMDTQNKTISVNAGAGLTFANGALKVNTGNDLTIGTDGKLNVNKSGEVSETDTGLVTGGTVYNALSAYAKSDGATLTNATLTGTTLTGTPTSPSNITDKVKLGEADSSITVGSLKTTVDSLNATVNVGADSLVAKVAAAEEDIAANAGDIETLQTAVAGKANAGTTLEEYGITDAYTKTTADNTFAKVDATNLSAANITAWGTALDTGTIAADDTGLVSGGKVFAVTDALDTRLSTAEGDIATNAGDIATLQTTVNGHTTEIGTINTSITGINDSITSLSTGKANVNLDNISDTGKAAVRRLISVAQGNNVTVTKSTSDTGVDTYTISTAGGVTYSAGDGIAISDTNAISVAANGAVEENNTGIVTGGTVYSALQAFKPDGKVEEGNAKAVSGDTVFTAIETAKTDVNAATEKKLASKANSSDVYTKAETYSQAEVDATLADYVKTEGATLTGATLTNATLSNAAIGSGSIADAVMLGDSISVGGLKSSVSENTSAINSLKSTVGDENDGLVKDVKDNKDSIDALATTVGDENSGLEQKVNSNASSITTLQDKTKNISATEGATTVDGTLSAGATTVTSLTDGTATLSGGALTGVTTITASGALSGGSLNVGTGAISGGTLSVGGMATVTGLTVGETNVTTALTTKGAVAENNAGFVTGGVVYSALQAYQPDGVIEDGNTKAVSGGTVYKVTSGLDARIKANADAIATKADASTVTELSGKVTANEAAIKTNADNITTLTGKVTANETAIKTNADNIAANTKNITANTEAIEKNASDITSLGTKVTANETAIKTNADNIAANTKNITANTEAIEKNASDITSLGTKVTANETAIKTNADNIAANTKNITANTEAIEKNASDITSLGTKVTANETAIKTNADNIAANTKNITANTEAIEKNASDITSLGTKVTANETAIKTNADNIAANTKNITANTEAIEKNASDITALGTKVTANETALAQKADKANTLKGYGIEDAYTKEDSDTLLNKKADKTELETVKGVVGNEDSGLVKDVNAMKVVVGDTNSGLVKDVNDLKNASQKITTDDQGNTKVDGTLVVGNTEGGATATLVVEKDKVVVNGNDVTTQLSSDGKVEENNHGYVEGDKVYDYLNKGENGEVKLAGESKQIAMGQGSEARGSESISIGNEVGGQKNEASGTQSIAIGFGNKVTGSHSGAFGDPNTVEGDNSWAFGNSNKVPGSNSIVLGNKNEVSGSNTFVLGSNVNTNATNAVVLGDGSVGVDNAVSVGAPGNERQIKNVAPGTEATDVATMGQVYTVAQNINKVDNRLNKVGAGAAALAALHPIDTDDKFTMGLGYGNYRSAHAMAMGMFYRPTEKIMISVGGAFGNGENMVNAGISFALDKGKGFGTSKAVMAKNIKALSAENAAIKEENAGMKKQLDAQGQEIAALKAALARLEAKIGK